MSDRVRPSAKALVVLAGVANVGWAPVRPPADVPPPVPPAAEPPSWPRPASGQAPPDWQPLRRPAELPPPPVAGPRVILTVDNRNGRLQQQTQLRWRDVCLAPCGYTLDPAGRYRIGGGTSLASTPFVLPRASGDVYVDARVASKVTHFFGLGLMIAGLVTAGYGTVLAALAVADDTPDGDTGMRNIAIVLFSVTAVLEAVGLPLFLKGTTVQVR